MLVSQSESATNARDEVGQSLDRALDYAKKAKGFAECVPMWPMPQAGSAEIGINYWYKLLAIVGLAA